MLTDILLFFLGLALLMYGAHGTIKHAVKLSKILNLDEYGVGAGILATVTSLPELVVAVIAVLEGVPSVAVGTAFGSVVGLLLLSIGLLSLIAPISFPKERKGELLQALVIIVGVVLVATLLGTFPLVLGVVLFLLYVAYIRGLHEETISELSTQEKRQSAYWIAAKIVFFIALVIIGAEILTKTVTAIAEDLGISTFVIAFIAIALGTNIPEISLDVAAVLRGHVGIALGDILGSAVADLTLVLGAAAVVGALIGTPLTFGNRTHIVAGILFGTAVVLWRAAKDERITIWEGVGLILAYLLVISLEVLTMLPSS